MTLQSFKRQLHLLVNEYLGDHPSNRKLSKVMLVLLGWANICQFELRKNDVPADAE